MSDGNSYFYTECAQGRIGIFFLFSKICVTVTLICCIFNKNNMKRMLQSNDDVPYSDFKLQGNLTTLCYINVFNYRCFRTAETFLQTIGRVSFLSLNSYLSLQFDTMITLRWRVDLSQYIEKLTVYIPLKKIPETTSPWPENSPAV